MSLHAVGRTLVGIGGVLLLVGAILPVGAILDGGWDLPLRVEVVFGTFGAFLLGWITVLPHAAAAAIAALQFVEAPRERLLRVCQAAAPALLYLHGGAVLVLLFVFVTIVSIDRVGVEHLRALGLLVAVAVPAVTGARVAPFAINSQIPAGLRILAVEAAMVLAIAPWLILERMLATAGDAVWALWAGAAGWLLMLAGLHFVARSSCWAQEPLSPVAR